MIDSKVFRSEEPSIFVISTPFQALCALAAVRQLKISEYLIIAHLPKGQETRNSQLRKFLDDNGMSYRRFVPNGFSFRFYKALSLLNRRKGYTRLFLGNHNDSIGLFIGCCYISDGANVIYLDDGVQSVSLFRGALLERKNAAEIQFIERLAKKRKIDLMRYFLTIYDGIPNNDYVIHRLNLSSAIKGQSIRVQSGVIIVGIVLEESCIIYNISRAALIDKLKELFARVKQEYPGEEIIYIPHGRDKSEYAQEICDYYGAKFMKCDSMIEVALLEKGITPKAIIGYTSSALYSLKQLFPETRVINIVYRSAILSTIFQETVSISEYYSEKGIELIEEKI